MPRGTRALHDINGSQVHGEPLVAFVPFSRWLLCQCHCARHYVAALQCDIRDGVPTSCGRAECVGMPTPIIVERPGANSDDYFDGWVEQKIAESMGAPILRRRGRARVVQRAAFEARHPEAAEERQHRVAWRREDVRQKWREGKDYRSIAKELDLPLYTVTNDMNWLRVKGHLDA